MVTGKVTDIGGFRKQEQRWYDEVKPGAIGFLGGTSGTTDDGRFIVVARFESADAAQRNNERPEQGAWFEEMSKFVSDVEFHDSTNVMTLFGGGSDDANVRPGHARSRHGSRQAHRTRVPLTPSSSRCSGEARPDVIGEAIAYHDDGDGYTDVVYFTSEADARANEQKRCRPRPRSSSKS